MDERPICFMTANEKENLIVHAIKFNPYIVDRNIFAAVVGYHALVYECVEEEAEIHVKVEKGQKENTGMKRLIYYQAKEVLLSLDWSYDTRHDDDPILAFAGESGVIRVIGISQKTDFALNNHSR